MKKATKINLVLLALILSANGLYAQQGFGTKSPNKASVIDMTSGTKGLLVPRVALTSTTVFAPVSGVDAANQHTANSLLVYNTATTGSGTTAVSPGYYYWEKPNAGIAGKWVRLADSNAAYIEPWQIQGTSEKAINNSQHIYQAGKVAVGFTESDPVRSKQFEIKGDFLAKTPIAIDGMFHTFGTNLGGNTVAGLFAQDLLTTSPSTMSSGSYSLYSPFISVMQTGTPASSGVVASMVNMAIGNQATTNVLANSEAGKFVSLEMRSTAGESNNFGKLVSSDPVEQTEGQLYIDNNYSELEHSNIGSGTDKSSKIRVNKVSGVEFYFGNKTGNSPIGNYRFPQTNGSVNQVLTTNGINGTADLTWTNVGSLITNSLSSSGNLMSSTVAGGISQTANIINTNALSLSSNQLVSTVNGVASTALNLTPAIKANQQNTIVQGTGAISVPAAVTAGNNTTYTVGVNTATSTALGVVRPGAGLSINSGVLSVNASATGIGKTLTGSGITVTAGSTVGTGTSVASSVLADVTLGIADNAITSAKINNGSIQGEDLNANVAGNGLTQAAGGALQVNTYNGIKVNTAGTYNDHVGLGGPLNEATTITTTANNTLSIAGLQTGTSADKNLVATSTGVVKQVRQAPRFFYMPSVIFNTAVSGADLKRDLYNDYRNQFTGQPYGVVHGAGGLNGQYTLPYTGGLIRSGLGTAAEAPTAISVYAANELYYYITYYDQTVFSNVRIDANGIMTYDIIGSSSDASYMNIVFVVKE